MKRYLLFGGHSYYPDGGWYDFISCHDELADAVWAGNMFAGFGEWVRSGTGWIYDHELWWHVADTENPAELATTWRDHAPPTPPWPPEQPAEKGKRQ